jgi:hypothetical protein
MSQSDLGAVETMLVDVRANTQAFAADVAAMRSTFDGTLVDGFSRAGEVLERGLLGAIRKGSLGFEDLQRIALRVLDGIAQQAMGTLFDAAGIGGGGSGNGGGIGGLFTGLIGSVLGLPGRATGGPVAPDRPYLVGERGPELFVPTSAGRVETGTGSPREVRVSIHVATPRGSDAPQALQRFSRQVASAVRRALTTF